MCDKYGCRGAEGREGEEVKYPMPRNFLGKLRILGLKRRQKCNPRRPSFVIKGSVRP